jgi:hypothetical protein
VSSTVKLLRESNKWKLRKRNMRELRNPWRRKSKNSETYSKITTKPIKPYLTLEPSHPKKHKLSISKQMSITATTIPIQKPTKTKPNS